ncbi:MAG TPA: amidase [Mycobacteriales bacterium]|nr:amidase [Mycobacteriales bacterium]
MSDLHHLTAAEQLRALRLRTISSRDLTQHYLERIDRLDRHVGAFVSVQPEQAMAAAAGADERLAAGESAPLLGLPLGIKDLYATAGARTTFGSAAVPELTPPSDAWTVALLRRAGAVLIGKTNTAEFGATCYTHNEVTDRPAVTPYDVTRYASGSSGGAAAAVAAGLLPLAHAGDGAGSTRTPAATCHLVGLKPSRGLVTSTVPPPSLVSTTIEGPITRTVEDAALLLDVMAQPWCGDPEGWRPELSFADAITQPLERSLRVATWTATGLEDTSPHPQTVAAVERTATLLREMGHTVREVPVPAVCDPTVRAALHTWFAASVDMVVSALVPADRRHLLLPYTRHLATAGAALSGGDVLAAQAVLARYASAFLAALDGFDVALTPVTSGPPVPVGHFTAEGVEAVADSMLAWSCYTPWANLTGQPAICLPSHIDRDGLPHGVQLVGRPRQDALILVLAAEIERAVRWDDVHPSCWDQ